MKSTPHFNDMMAARGGRGTARPPKAPKAAPKAPPAPGRVPPGKSVPMNMPAAAPPWGQ